MKLYRRLFSYTRPYRAVFAFAILGMLLVASTDVMMLQLVRPMINDMGQVDADRGRLLAFLIVGVFVLRGIGSYVSEYGLAWIGSRVVFDVRGEACDRLLRPADAVLRRVVRRASCCRRSRTTRSRSPRRPPRR